MPTEQKQARRVARDVLGLADAGHMDAAAAGLGGADHLDRGANMAEIDLAPQRPELGQAQFEEALDFDRGSSGPLACAGGSISGSACSGHRVA